MKLIPTLSPSILLGFLSSLFFFHCMGTSKIVDTTPELDFHSEEYYMQFQSSELRAAQLMCGRFSCYNGASGNLFGFNDDNDSIVVHTIMVGDVGKDGTWVYKEAWMSNFTEKPLAQLFQKIERISPDSLLLSEYRPKSKKNDYIGYYKRDRKDRAINLKDLISTGCQAGIKKVNQTTFVCFADMCERNKGDQTKWVDIKATYTPASAEVKSIYYSQSDRSEQHIASTSFMIYKRWGIVD